MYLQNQPVDDNRKKRIQMDITILESDLRKRLTEKVQLEAEIRKLKQDGERLKVMLDEKRTRFEKVQREIFAKEEECKALKKKIYGV